MATFAGSKSYWPSYAETALGVQPAPPEKPAAATPEQVQSTVDQAVQALQPIIHALIVLVIIAIIIGIYSIYDHRKLRK